MAFRNLDNNHDWTFGIGRNNYVSGSQEVLLNVQTRILSFLGDCFFAPLDGIDWWRLLDYNKQEEAENAVMATIAETEGVESVNQIDSYINSQRRLTLSYSITDIYGNTNQREFTPIL